MTELDPPSDPEQSRSSGAIPDRSGARRPDLAPPETDLIVTKPAVSSPRGAGSGSTPSTDQRARDAAAGLAPRALPNLGEKIDEFRLIESIGAGGMGAVFRAVDVGLDRQVALKILPPEQAVDPEVVRRYHQEGRAAARLDHDNIARVYTIGDDGRYHYIAFEYIEGVTIRQRVIQDGPLAVRDAIHFTLQIAQALMHAAEREVVHRDIKPSNIIITPGGRAKLVDMGLARQFERRSDADLTQTGMTLGTFDYISPEQARDPRDVDIRGDLYSLGCTLFHMLSGRPPFPEGTVLQKLLQHREETPTDIRRLNPTVPDALAAILVKLLVKDRDHRYQTPEHLARDLGRLSGRGPSVARIPARSRSTPNWARHLFWGGPGLVFLLVLGGLAWWGDGPPAPPSVDGSGRSGTSSSAGGDAGLFAPGVFPSRPDVPGAATGRPTSPIPSPEAAPPREVAVGPTDDLARILAEAPPRSSILLIERGPYELRANHLIRLDQRDLTIRAEAGVRPVIRLAPGSAAFPGLIPVVGPSAPRTALIDVRGGRVTFDGIDFLLDVAGFESVVGLDRAAPAGSRVLAALAVEDAEVIVRRCSFRRVGGGPTPGAGGPGSDSGGRVAAIRLQGSTRANSGRGDGLVTALVADASDFDGHQIGLLALGPVDVSLRDVGFGPTTIEQAAIWADNPDTSGTPTEFRLDHVSGLLGAGPMFRFTGTTPRIMARHSVFGPVTATTESTPAHLVAIDVPDRLDWRGADNLYARVGVYLRATGARAQAPIRAFKAWADDPTIFRESGSDFYDGVLWERLPLTSQSPTHSPESPRSFRLALPRSVVHHPGARWGPAGPLPPPVGLASPGLANRIIPPEPPAATDRAPGPPAALAPAPAAPPNRASTLVEPRVEPGEEIPNGLTPMPMPPPPDLDRPPADDAPDSSAVAGTDPAPPTPPRPAPVADGPPLIRSTAQFLDALKRDEPGARTLVLAADADLDLPSGRIAGPAHWTIRGERGPTRPRLRFHAAAESPEAAGWSAWMVLRSGGLRLEGVDLILPAARTPLSGGAGSPPRLRTAFAIRAGTADLVLADCTVTIEGDDARSAVVAILPGDDPVGIGSFGDFFAAPLRALGASETRVRFNDCMLRSSGDLVDVAPGRSVELDLDNSVVATSGVLVHGHGREEGRAPGSLRVALRRIATRLVGGLIHLESDRDRPSLPVASIRASDTILALVNPETPLIRVDGQGELPPLRDRVVWQGRSVAYHRVNTYRRDQTTRPGVAPTRVDRDEWESSLGRQDEAAIRGDLGFVDEGDLAQPAWSIRPENLRLRTESPASDAAIGPDLLHIPEPPLARVPAQY